MAGSVPLVKEVRSSRIVLLLTCQRMDVPLLVEADRPLKGIQARDLAIHGAPPDRLLVQPQAAPRCPCPCSPRSHRAHAARHAVRSWRSRGVGYMLLFGSLAAFFNWRLFSQRSRSRSKKRCIFDT